MKQLVSILTFFLLIGCAVQEDPGTNSDPEDVEPEYLELDPEYIPYDFVADGYGFTETSNCDTLTEEELIHIDTSHTFDLKIWTDDSIHISYYDVGNVCGFFEGYYEFENDTVFIRDREDAYDGCGDYCLFKLEYTVPKPATVDYVIMVNGKVEIP